MGFFSSPADKYPQEKHQLAEIDLKRWVTHEHIPTLDQYQVELVRSAILHKREAGKISLRNVYELLEHMVLKYEISTLDRDGVLRIIEEHLGNV